MMWTARTHLRALAIVFAACSALPALAACPAPPAGEESAASRHDRLLCQNREIYEQSQRRYDSFALQSQNRRLEQLQMQRRLDNLPQPSGPEFDN